jgi:uncharacterized protein
MAGRLVRACLGGALIWFALAAPSIAADPAFPPLTGRVVDAANLLSAEEETALAAKLEAHEQKTTNQFVVVTLPSLQGFDIADYGVRLGRHWQIGQKDRGNGVILIVAPNERRVRIEVGYGLEGTLTDALSNVIITGAILPRFRNGDFSGGIRAGVDDILTVLDGDGEEIQERARAVSVAEGPDLIHLLIVLCIIAFWCYVLIRSFRYRGGKGRGGIGPIWAPGGWSGGSGGGGGGGGGFSGGGGSFGGGGSSGGW